MRELIKSMLSFSWGMSLFGVKQLSDLLTSYGQPTSSMTTAFEAVTRTTAMQFDAVNYEVFQTGDHWQRGIVDLLGDCFMPMVFKPRRMMKMSFDMMQYSGEVGRWLMPGREGHLAWQEFQNKLHAFNLFEHVDVALALPARADLPLTELVAQADALDSYDAIWTTEGLGRYYAEMWWQHNGTPQYLLTDDRVSTLPARSLIPLHTGMGLSLAERLLATVSPQPADAAVDMMLHQFIALCKRNARPGYTGAVMEALGLVTRLRYPQLVHSVDQRLSTIEPDIAHYFWHGVGRGLYFHPLNAVPCSSATWHAMQMARGEASHAWSWLNALAGLAWALTLVNIKHPEILEAFLKQYGNALSANDAFAQGVRAAIIIWYDIRGDDPYLRAFCQHQPDRSDPGLVRLWNTQVRGTCQTAQHYYDSVLKAQYGLDEVFRYQPLSAGKR
jgi:hypothetical protein